MPAAVRFLTLLSAQCPESEICFIKLRAPLARFGPFAEGLRRRGIIEFASSPEEFHWEKRTLFGGPYRKTVAYHR